MKSQVFSQLLIEIIGGHWRLHSHYWLANSWLKAYHSCALCKKEHKVTAVYWLRTFTLGLDVFLHGSMVFAAVGATIRTTSEDFVVPSFSWVASQLLWWSARTPSWGNVPRRQMKKTTCAVRSLRDLYLSLSSIFPTDYGYLVIKFYQLAWFLCLAISARQGIFKLVPKFSVKQVFLPEESWGSLAN